MISALVIVDDLHVVGVAFPELETNTPTLVDRHRPLSFAVAFELVQPDAPQGAEIAERLGDVQSKQQFDRSIEIEPAKLVRTVAIPDLRLAEFRQDLIMAKTYYGKR
jgi:hypothetical protein